MGGMIRLVVVEDDPMTLTALRTLFSSAQEIKLVGAYSSAEAALQATDWAAVDVLLTDLDLPGLNGDQLIAVALGHHPALLALAHTMHEGREELFAALRAGACGYLVKGTPAPQILQAIRGISGGETPISAVVARHLVANFHQADSTTAGEPEEALTPREELVLQQFAHGQSYEQIAADMGISVHTVHSHIRKVYGKLHINSRKEALRLVRERGYFGA